VKSENLAEINLKSPYHLAKYGGLLYFWNFRELPVEGLFYKNQKIMRGQSDLPFLLQIRGISNQKMEVLHENA